MFTVSHQIAGITFQTQSDVQIPHLSRPVFAQFQTDHTLADLNFRIRELDSKPSLLFPHRKDERKLLLQTIGFPKHWLDRLVLRSPDVWQKIQVCLEHPELVHIGLRWGNYIIRNYALNELDYFYEPEKRKNFSAPAFIAPHRILFASFMPNFSAVMLHGAGVIRNDLAILFLASDEGGKSSMVKLSDGMPVLNDDQVILRKQAGLMVVHGTPFGPHSSGPVHSKLGAIFLLEKATSFSITPVPVSEVVEFIWKENDHLWFVMPKKLKIQAFNLIVDACRQALVYRLQFPKGFVDWDLIDQTILRPIR